MKEHIYSMVSEFSLSRSEREVFRFKDQQKGVYKNILWKDLGGKIEEVARALLSLQFHKDDNIGIISNNRPEWTIADIGITGIRAVVVPIFSSASVKHINYIARETKMRLLFVSSLEDTDKWLKVFNKCTDLKYIVYFERGSNNLTDNRFIFWDDFLKLGSDNKYAEEVKEISSSALSSDLATIIYTSGTTGEPKGVMLDHSNFFFSFAIHNERLFIGENEVSLCFLPLSHIFERAWTYYLLYRGAVNVYFDNPKSVMDVIKEVKPNFMCTVPRLFEKTYEGIRTEYNKWSSLRQYIFRWGLDTGKQVLQYKLEKKKLPFSKKIKSKLADKLVLSKLRDVFGGNIRFLPCAGAAIKKDLLKFFHAAGINITYGYGATETTATVSCFTDDFSRFDTCGKIMPGVKVKIDSNSEIIVKGGTVFKGYYNKPAETTEVLSDGWYRTGDAGFITESNELVMTDRLRDIFKTSSGKMVSPQKLELLISALPWVEQVVVFGDNRKYVTAIIVPSTSGLISAVMELGLQGLSIQEMMEHPKILERFRNQIDRKTADLNPYEKIVKFSLIEKAFSLENDMLTNTLKIKRRMVEEKYASLIEEMYNSENEG